MTKEKLALATNVEKAIRSHGEETYPHECCGLLLGRIEDAVRRVKASFPIDNAREEDARGNRYLISPDEYRRGEVAARAQDLEVVGFYHSHPDHPARPSAFDLEHAWPWYAYAIVAVEKGRSGALAAFRLREDREAFVEEPVVIEPPRSTTGET